MKAVQFSRFGAGHDVAEIVELPEPGPPGPGEVLLDVLAAPINPSDLLNFAGRYGAVPPSLPAFAGGEAVARVAALGPGVTHLMVEDRVLALYAGRGNWRERVLARADALFPLPTNANTLQLAMMAVNPATAWNMLHRFVTLRPGDWVMQNAGNSGVGHNVIKIAGALGVHSISVVRDASQVAPLRAIGADVVLVDGDDLKHQVVHATGGAPVRLGIDAVAGEATRKLGACVADGGTVVIYGVLSGDVSSINASDILFRNIALRGFWFSAWRQTVSHAEQRQMHERLGELVANGTIAVPVEATYPLTRIKEALAHAARPGRTGKVLLVMNE